MGESKKEPSLFLNISQHSFEMSYNLLDRWYVLHP